MSEHARQLIQNFLCNVAGREAGDESDQDEGDRSDVDEDVPRLDVKPGDLRQILTSTKLMTPADDGEEGAKENGQQNAASIGLATSGEDGAAARGRHDADAARDAAFYE